jgi:hypothetical protein
VSRRLEVEPLEARTVPSTIRTLVSHQITALPAGTYHGVETPAVSLWPVLSANGNRAVFFTVTSADGIAHVQVINADGTGQREVDSYPGGPYVEDISADGSKVLTVQGQADGYHFRVVNADGTDLHDAVVVAGGYVSVSLSSSGSQVYFTDDRDFSIGGQPETGGLYVVNTDGSGLREIAGAADIGKVLGIPASDVSARSRLNGGLKTSADNSRIVFIAGNLLDGTERMLGVNLDGSGLHEFNYGPPLGLDNVGISGDGSKAFYFGAHPPCCSSPNELGVFNFDGTGQKVLASFPPNFFPTDPNAPQSIDPIQLTNDGAQLLAGSTGVLIDTTTNPPTDLQLAGGLKDATMNSMGTRFLYVTTDANGIQQLAVLDVNPASVGSAPSITNPMTNPAFLVVNHGSTATVSAQVSASGTLDQVSVAFLKDGLNDNQVAPLVLFDDGPNGGHGDAVAGDGTFTNNRGDAASDAMTGPRTVRFQADSHTSDGKRYVTTLDVQSFDIVTQPPTSDLQFSTGTYAVNEEDGAATITVTRTLSTAGAVTVHYATSDGTATAGTDYTAVSGDLTFNDGEATRTFTIPILDDQLVEGNATVNLTLGNPTGGAVLGTPSTAALTITDNDVALPGQLQFTDSNYQVNETDGSATITLTRTGGSNVPVTVDYATSDGTAHAGSAYTATSGTLTFGVGETSKTFTVPILDDPVYIGNRTLNLTLSSPTGGAALGSPATAVLTIVESDPPASSSQFDIYASDGQGKLFTLNAATGQVHVLGTMGVVMTDLAFDGQGTLYGVAGQGLPGGDSFLYRIDPRTAGSTRIGDLGDFVNALVFGPDGTLDAAGGKLYRVDVSTGAGTAVGNLSGFFSAGDLAFDAAGTLYMTTTTNELVKVDPATGSATLIGPLGFADVFGMVLGPNDVLYGFSDSAHQFFSINTSTGAGTLITDFGGQGVSGAYGAAIPGSALLRTGVTPLVGVEGTAVSGVVVSFTDTDPGAAAGDFTATVAWGDGTTSTGTVSANGAGGFDVTASHTYASAGNFAPSVAIADVDGARFNATASATIGDAPLSALVASISPTAGTSFVGAVSVVTDTNPLAAGSDLAVTISWGDGHTTAGSLVPLGGGRFEVVGSNTYATGGTYTLGLAVRDAGGAAATSSNPVFVATPPSPTSQGITARLVAVKAGRGRTKLVVRVFDAATGELVDVFTSPYQAPKYTNIKVSVRDSSGDGVPDLVVVTAKKGRRTVTATFSYAD